MSRSGGSTAENETVRARDRGMSGGDHDMANVSTRYRPFKHRSCDLPAIDTPLAAGKWTCRDDHRRKSHRKSWRTVQDETANTYIVVIAI
jgi:hypothetical protein